jgi:hypothetical protein
MMGRSVHGEQLRAGVIQPALVLGTPLTPAVPKQCIQRERERERERETETETETETEREPLQILSALRDRLIGPKAPARPTASGPAGGGGGLAGKDSAASMSSASMGQEDGAPPIELTDDYLEVR